ncbi:TPA: hypothetical protein QDZ75_004184 [Stenotrophomonas maltophilia]|nr:hypothetical protein [Stenotrophomonas maltophilia]
MNEIELKARELLAEMARGFGQPEYAYHIGCGGVLDKGDRKLIAPLIAALTPQWQPIETAPKDGTAILLTNGKDVAEGHWYFEECGTTEHRDLDGRYIDQTESEGYDGWLDWDGGMQPDPTHWMPRPSPPEVNG